MKKRWIMAGVSGILILCCFQVNWALGTSMFSFVFVRLGLEIAKSFKKIFNKCVWCIFLKNIYVPISKFITN